MGTHSYEGDAEESIISQRDRPTYRGHFDEEILLSDERVCLRLLEVVPLGTSVGDASNAGEDRRERVEAGVTLLLFHAVSMALLQCRFHSKRGEAETVPCTAHIQIQPNPMGQHYDEIVRACANHKSPAATLRSKIQLDLILLSYRHKDVPLNDEQQTEREGSMFVFREPTSASALPMSWLEKSKMHRAQPAARHAIVAGS